MECRKRSAMIGSIESYPNLYETINRKIFSMAMNSVYFGEYSRIKLIKLKAKISSQERKV